MMGGSVQHVSSQHEITVLRNDRRSLFKEGDRKLVNSFHNQGVVTETLGRELSILAKSSDGVVEAIEHQSMPILGIMWHPERPRSDVEFDKRLVSSFFD